MRRHGHGAIVRPSMVSKSHLRHCTDRFCYMFPGLARRTACVLKCDAGSKQQLEALGVEMTKETEPSGATDNVKIPAGFTYLGQFVDHDITFSPFATFDCGQKPAKTMNLRSARLDLDSVYGRGPAVDPFLYVQNTNDPKKDGVLLLLGTNRNTGPGGPGHVGIPSDFDVPRNAQNVALLGDPRNDENLIVSQLHHAFLKFHNSVANGLPSALMGDDRFAEARRIVTQHYQWVVLHDLVVRLVGHRVLNSVLQNGPRFFRQTVLRMPVEFAVAAYRLGHSMVRDKYALNDNFQNQPFADVFAFVRPPNLPVLSNWVIDFNRFFDSGSTKPVNASKRLDTKLARSLSSLPGAPAGQLMARLASRNLVRGVSFGLPSGQCIARRMGVTPLTSAELLQGVSAPLKAVLEDQNKRLLKKTPLWYYVLKEAEVRRNGERLGAVGARIVAETFVRMLMDDPDSILNVPGGFTPTLSPTPGGPFTMVDLLRHAGVIA